jgi:hypothetical protein
MLKKLRLLIILSVFLGFGVTAWSLSPHKDYATMKINDCNACHQSSGVTPNHGGFWTKEHRLYAEKRPNNCQDCHQLSDCLDCHTGGGIDQDLHVSTSGANYMPKSHRTDFREIHPIKAQDDPRSCYRCHDAERFCAACHSRFPKGTLNIKSHQMLGPHGQRYTFAIGEHSREARRNLQSCQACHPDGDVCIQCHSSGKTNPHPRSWNPRSSHGRDGKLCLRCHLPGTF